ncbi:MAG: glycoside hydrolase family 78 protein [Lentisphaerae bacterium]|nr:glycoside hydrolase family 78 protein [Lentisphaerota bacterium]
MFRKSFDLAAVPVEAMLHITAADRYVLYVNGVYLGHGPARSVGPQWMSYDTHDVTPHLRAGANTIAVMAYFHGCRNAWSANQRAGLFAQLEWRLSDGACGVMGTDATWRLRAVQGYSPDVGMVSHWLGNPNEVLDARLDPCDWMSTACDDSAWPVATVIPAALYAHDHWLRMSQRSCWSALEPRLTPRLRERAVAVANVVQAGEVQELAADAFSAKQIPERLAAEPHVALEQATAVRTETLLGEGPGDARLATSGDRSAFLILDFGRPVLGRPVLEFEAPEGAVIDVVCVHLLENGRANPLGQASRIGDRYVARAGRQTWSPFFLRVVRYLQVVVRNAPAGVRFHRIGVAASEYPCERRGAFACSDPVLTSLWDVGVRTVVLHMEDTMTIDPVRERLAYFLCGEIEQLHLAAFAAFGDLPITDQGFRQTTRSQLADGLMPCFIGSSLMSSLGCRDDARESTSGANPLAIPNYSCFYALAVWRHYERTAHPGFLDEHYPALVRIADWCARHADETGLLYGLPNWVWLDWMKSDLRGSSVAINAVYAQMLTDMAHIADVLEQPRDAARWRARAETVRAQLRKNHWNAARGLFADGVLDGVQSGVFTELANALALLHGVATPVQAASIVRQLTDPASDIVRCSPLYFHYVLEALIAGGAAAEAYAYLSRRYAALCESREYPMLCEAWPEQTFSGASASSIHGGGAGVVWTLTQHVLGIRPAEPGYAAVVFDPRPGNLTWAKGVVPTPRGDIQVAWRRGENGRLQHTVKVPDGVRLVERTEE